MVRILHLSQGTIQIPKLTIEVEQRTIDFLVVHELKESIDFCKRHEFDEFIPAMEKVMEFFMTSFEFYQYNAERGNYDD